MSLLWVCFSAPILTSSLCVVQNGPFKLPLDLLFQFPVLIGYYLFAFLSPNYQEANLFMTGHTNHTVAGQPMDSLA